MARRIDPLHALEGVLILRLAICNEMFENWAFEDICRFVADVGYEGIEVAPFTLAPCAAEIHRARRQDLRRTAERFGLQIIGLHWLLVSPQGLHLLSSDVRTRRQTADYMMELVDLCTDLGGKILVLGSGKQRDIRPPVTEQMARSYLKEAVELCFSRAEERGVLLCLEPLSREVTNFINTAAEAVDILDEIAHPCLRLHLDVKAMHDQGEPIQEVIAMYADRLAHVHVNDPNGLGPGMGQFNLRPVLTALRQAGYSGYLSVETFDFSRDPREVARRSYNYLRSIIAEMEAS